MSTVSLASEDMPIGDIGDPKDDFFKKYEPGATLGEGLSSVVRRCISKQSHQEYAVKIIDRDEEKDAMVRLEIDILSILSDHPNIIKLIDYYETKSNFFLVFHLATDGELFDYLTRMVTLSEQQARVMFIQILKAVEYMHSKNVVHRDLKPENILLGAKSWLYISDFGFSVQLKDGQFLRDLCGTPDYLAPEVLKCSMDENHPGYGKPIDLWACGVILFIMLAGFSPFWHRKQSVMLWNIMDGKYNLESNDWADISKGAKDIISRLLVTDPTKRLTIEQTLAHPWISGAIIDVGKPVIKRMSLKSVVLAVLSFKYVYKLVLTKRQLITLSEIKSNPYQLKFFRHIMDTCAFQLYDHWIRRSNVQHQNRAALFQNVPKLDEEDIETCRFTQLPFRTAEHYTTN